jgi:ribosomal protein S18 acetylase RimI-like enzyme
MIRLARTSDSLALGQLGAALMRKHYEFDPLRFLTPREETADGYARFLGSVLDDPECVVFVADEDGEIHGYVFGALEPLSWKELRGPAGFIHDLLVVENACRRGLGTELMNAALHWLRERGAPRVLLGTAAQNKPAQALFKRLGFRETMIEMTLEL